MTQDDKVFDQLVELTEIQMDGGRKQFIRDELQRQMEAERRPRTGWRRKFDTLAPIGVRAAAAVVAGAGIVAVLTHKNGSTLTLGPVQTTFRETAGSVAAGPSGNTFATNNTWFYVTMGALVAAMVLLFVTRRREVRKVWVQEILAVLRAPILWGLVLGVVVGIRGIPVTVPNHGSYWVWEEPTGFYVVSVAGLGAIGFLIGAAIQFARRQVIAGHLAFWGLAFPALVMLFGMVTFYRGQAQTEDTLWGLARNGLEYVDSVGLRLPTYNSRADLRVDGTLLVQAAGDIGAASQYAGKYGIHGNLYDAAQALEEAGYNLGNSTNAQKVKQAENFARQAGAIVRKVAVATHGNVNAQNMPQLFDEISKITPSDYSGYMPN